MQYISQMTVSTVQFSYRFYAFWNNVHILNIAIQGKVVSSLSLDKAGYTF